MSTNKKLRTPIIKPRTQGGTFYTFGSALEDVGLNINELNNKVELSHYVLLNIPEFDQSTGFKTHSTTTFSSDKNVGDYKFAEGLQDYVLNMETVLRNQSNYNFASSKTVSERVFWKWLKTGMSFSQYTNDQSGSTHYLDSNVVKCFGIISAGAQRNDDYGIYNETFVQIPSSYAKTKVFFNKVEDENYHIVTNGTYACTNTNGYIENISADELDSNHLIKTTGISGMGAFDASTYYTASEASDFMSVVFDIDELRSIYGDTTGTLTFDDIAMNNTPDPESVEDFEFNAILVYYSIYNSTGKSILATNAYGVLILDNAMQGSTASTYKFPSLLKKKSTPTSTGTSFSFRLNIKTTSAYSGDIYISDNSTPSYEMAEDFNDVVRNLSKAVDVLHSNAAYLAVIADENKSIKALAATAIDKVTDLEKIITNIKIGQYFDNANVSNIFVKDNLYDNVLTDQQAKDLLSATSITYDDTGNLGIDVDTTSLSGLTLTIGNALKSSDSSNTYNSIMGMLAILMKHIKANV